MKLASYCGMPFPSVIQMLFGPTSLQAYTSTRPSLSMSAMLMHWVKMVGPFRLESVKTPRELMLRKRVVLTPEQMSL